MISTDAASLAFSIAQGLIKLGGRIDLLLAERSAVSGEFLVPVPPVAAGPSMPAIRKELRAYLDDTADAHPDPLGEDRKRLARLLDQASAPDELGDFYLRIFPSKASPAPLDPDATYLRELRTRMPGLDWADESTRRAAFFIASGRDDRELGYPLRLGLLVADTLAEMGAQNTGRVVRDPRLADGVRAVLEHFAQPDLGSFTEWAPLLQHVLSATLNGMLDARGAVSGKNPWLDAVLLALARAREESGNGEDYLAGLMEGQGYGLLVSEGLTLAAARLDEAGAPAFQEIAADLLAAAAPLVKENKRGFAGFFNDHWADLLHASIVALEKHGAGLLQGEDPLLKVVLTSLLGELASTSAIQWFTRDMVIHLTDAAVGAIASHEDLWKPSVHEPWLEELVTSAVGMVASAGIRSAFTPAGLETLATTVLQRFAANPGLLIHHPGLPFDLVAAILKAVAAAGPFDAQRLASAAVPAALAVLEQHAAALGEELAPAVEALCAGVAEWVQSGRLTGAVSADLVVAALEAIGLNPALFVQKAGDLLPAAVEAVLEAAAGSTSLPLSPPLLLETLDRILAVLARRGQAWLERRNLKPLVALLSDAIATGLDRAARDLGRGLTTSEVPRLLAGIVESLALGQLEAARTGDPAFEQLYTTLLKALSTP